MKAPRLASLKLRVEQLETRDVPAVLLTDTSTVTTSVGVTARLTVTVDDNAGPDVYHWNYHLHNLTPGVGNPLPNDPDPIKLFEVLAAPGSVTAGTVGSSVSGTVILNSAGASTGVVTWYAPQQGVPLVPGGSADFWFDTGAVDIADGSAEFLDIDLDSDTSGVFLTKTPGEPAQLTADPDPQIAITSGLNTLYGSLPAAINKLDTASSDGSVGKALAKLGELNAALNAVETALAAVVAATSQQTRAARQTILNDRIGDYNTAVRNFSDLEMVAVFADANSLKTLADQVRALIAEGSGDTFRYQGLGSNLSRAVGYLDTLQGSIESLNDRASELGVLTLDKAYLATDAYNLSILIDDFESDHSTYPPGNANASGIPYLNYLTGWFDFFDFPPLDSTDASSPASAASFTGSYLSTLAGTMYSAAQAGDLQTFRTALDNYNLPHGSYLSYVRDALSAVPDAAATLTEAKEEAASIASELGVADDFRLDGIDAAIAALRNSVDQLEQGAALLLGQIDSLATLFASNGNLAPIEIQSFAWNYEGLLLQIDATYAQYLANL